jgi:hypothetical protein
MFTKNVSSDLYEKHKHNYIMMREALDSMNWSIGRKGVDWYE